MTTRNPPDNGRAPVRRVRHAKLPPADEPARLARQCPACRRGALRLHRDPTTFELWEVDHCDLCGQRVRYLDIAELRKKDWAGT
jgi:hypothetical protein